MEIINLLVETRLCGLEEGLRRLCEDYTFAPACWHCKMRGGRKRMGECGKEMGWPRVAIREETLTYGSPCAFLRLVSAQETETWLLLLSLYSRQRLSTTLVYPTPSSLRPGTAYTAIHLACDANQLNHHHPPAIRSNTVRTANPRRSDETVSWATHGRRPPSCASPTS